MLAHWTFWSAFAGTGALLVLVAWLGSRRRRLSPKQIAAGRYPAACGSCGYDLTGLPGHICPECGSDLELVGRLSPRFHRWTAVPVTARLIVWTVVVGCIAAWLMNVAREHALPHVQEFEAATIWYIQTQETHPETGQPYAHAPVRITVTASFRRQASDRGYNTYSFATPHENTRWVAANVTCILTSPAYLRKDRTGALAVTNDSSSAQAILLRSASSPPSLPTKRAGEAGPVRGVAPETDSIPAALALALAGAGYSGESGSAEEIVAAIAPQLEQFLLYGAVSETSEGPLRTWGTQNGLMNEPRVAPIGYLLAGGFWFVVWVLGLPFILKKRPISIRRETVGGDESLQAVA